MADCAVVGIPDRYAGEIPKAFVVKATSASSMAEAEVASAVCKFVEEHKARYKWLEGGIKFVKAIPRSPSGKILRRLLRDEEKASDATRTNL